LNEAVVAERKWQFKARFRGKAYGWRGSRLAISRLKEAASEIKAAAKSDPVAAGDGAVSLMERIWPAFHRDGNARTRLQSHERHEHHGRPTTQGGDEGIVRRQSAAVCCCRTAQDAQNPHQKRFQRKNHQTPKNDHARLRRRSHKASILPPGRFCTTKTHT
jgi:hypothetical protein